jgi:GH18 family chitinase
MYESLQPRDLFFFKVVKKYGDEFGGMMIWASNGDDAGVYTNQVVLAMQE